MDLSDEYQLVKKKPLKLIDGVEPPQSAQKRKHKKTKFIKDPDPTEGLSEVAQVIVPTMTEAERLFKAKQEKIAQKRILQKASKTHKQRVEEFNKHLDSLSEHYDIPKVSWTK